MASDRPSDHPNNWRFQVTPVPPGPHIPVLQTASQEERSPSLRTGPLFCGERGPTAFWSLEPLRRLRMLVAFPAGLSLPPTRRMRASSMVHLVLRFTPLETQAGHSPAVELLAAPIPHTKLWPTRPSLAMSGFPPTLGSSTPPTLGQPSRLSRTSLRHGAYQLALLPIPASTLLSLLLRRCLEWEGSTGPITLE